MSTGRSIEAGKAFVRLYAEDGDFRRGLAAASKRLDNFGRAAQGLALKLGGLGAAMTAPFIAAVKGAADAQESLNRFNEVFGEQRFAAESFAVSLAQSIGRSKTEIRDALATFQLFFVGLGFGAYESRRFSEQLEELAIDFASFNNISDAEAVQRFISALSGSAEVLDKFGVNIRQAALQQQLLKQGITKTWSEVTEQEKAVARLAIIMRAMTDQGAVGDAARTSGSFSNQLKALTSSLRDLRDEVGAKLIPVATKWVSQLKDSVLAASKWVAENQQLVLIAAKLAVGLQALSVAIGAVGTASRLAAGAVKLLGAAGGLAAAALAGVVATLAAIAASEAVETGPLQGLNVDGLKNVDAAIEQTKARIAELKKEIASRGDLPADFNDSNMDHLAMLIPRGNLRLAEETLAALEEEKKRQTLPAHFTRNPALAPPPAKPAILPAGPIGLPNDRILGIWKNTTVAMAEAFEETFAGADIPETLSGALSKAQFGGRGAEQFFGDDNARRQVTLLTQIEKNQRRIPMFRIGNA